jgi:hypothetical protein
MVIVRDKPKRRGRKLGVWLGVLVVLGAGGYYAYKTLNQSTEGTVVQAKPQEEVSQKPVSDKQLAAKHFTATYPGAYTLQPAPAAGTTTASEVYKLTKHQSNRIGETAVLQLMTEPLPAGGVTESSPYKLYSTHPALYHLNKVDYGDDTAWVAIRTDPTYEHVILWPHAGNLLTISLLASSQSDDIDADLQTLQHSVKWQQ